MKYEAERQYREFQSKLGQEWQARGQPKPFERAERLVDKIGQSRNGQWVEVSKATAGWDDERGVTLIQRRKEEAADYRYFPEPDLVPVVVEPAWLEEVRAGLGELPAAQRQRLQTQYGLTAYDAERDRPARAGLRRLLRGGRASVRRRQGGQELDHQRCAANLERAQARHRRVSRSRPTRSPG